MRYVWLRRCDVQKRGSNDPLVHDDFAVLRLECRSRLLCGWTVEIRIVIKTRSSRKQKWPSESE